MIPATSHTPYWMRHRSVHVPCAASNARPILNPATNLVLYQMACQMQPPCRSLVQSGLRPQPKPILSPRREERQEDGSLVHIPSRPWRLCYRHKSLLFNDLYRLRLTLRIPRQPPGGSLKAGGLGDGITNAVGHPRASLEAATQNTKFSGVVGITSCADEDPSEKTRFQQAQAWSLRALSAGISNAINAVFPTDVKCLLQMTCMTVAEPSATGERSFAATVRWASTPKPPRFSALGQRHA